MQHGVLPTITNTTNIGSSHGSLSTDTRCLKDIYGDTNRTIANDTTNRPMNIYNDRNSLYDGLISWNMISYINLVAICVKSGCCKPPTVCGYVYVNETAWDVGGGVVGGEPDCGRWSNDQDQLCYACDSCKAGVLANLKKSWRKVSVVNIIVLIVLVISYVIGYATFRNNRRIDNNEPASTARMTKSKPGWFNVWGRICKTQ